MASGRRMWARFRFVLCVTVAAVALAAVVLPGPSTQVAAEDAFSANVAVNESFIGGRGGPAVALHDGVIYAVWHDRRDGDFDIYFSKSVNSGLTFGPDVRVNDAYPGESSHQLWPDIAVLGGVVYVVWEDAGDVYMARSLNGGRSFSPDERVDPAGGDDATPSIAVDPTRGWVLVAWSHSANEIRAARSVNGGPFGAPATVSGAPGADKRYPDIAVAPGGRAHVAWADGRNGVIAGPLGPEPDYDIYIASSADGLTWDQDRRLSDTPAGSVQTFPSIAVDAAGRVHAAWQDAASGQRTVRYSRADDGATFSPSVPVMPNPSYPPYGGADQQTPELAWDEVDQTVHVVWADKAGGNYNVRMASRAGDGGFRPSPTRAGGNRFVDTLTGSPQSLNGVWDPGEAVILDDGDGVLDAGVLDGIGSPDAVVVAGAANLAEDLAGQVLTYDDDNGGGSWDPGEDIVLDKRPVVYPHVEATKITAWDTTSGNFPSYLRWDSRDGDLVGYTVGPGELMSVGWFYVDGAKDEGVNPENFGLKDGDPISNVTLELSYTAPAGHPGGTLNYSFALGANSTLASLPSTGGTEVLRFFDLRAMGVDTVQELRDMNITFENADPGLTVSFNRMTLIIHRGLPGLFDAYDSVLSGAGLSAQGDVLAPLADGDDVMYLDSTLNGRYDPGEPLVLTAQDTPPGGGLTASDEILPRAGGGAWMQFLTPFPLNDDAGNAGQFSPSVAAGGGEVAVAWQDSRGGANAIYATTSAVDARPPEVLPPPLSESSNVSTGAGIRMAFREPVDPLTVVVTMDPLTPFTATWNPYGTEVVLDPLVPLLSNTSYTVTVSAAVDLAGNPLAAPVVFAFTTAAAPTIEHAPPVSLVAGDPLVIRANVSDDIGVDSVLLQLIPPGEAAAESYVMGLEAGDALAGVWRAEVSILPRPGVVRYAIVATDADGNVALSPSPGLHQVPMEDPAPPLIGHTPVEEAVAGSAVTFRATASDVSGVARVTVRMKPPGATEFGPPLAMRPEGDGYAATVRIPPAEGTLFYYIQAEDGFGNVATYPEAGASGPLAANVRPPPSADLLVVAVILAAIILPPIAAIRWVARPGPTARAVRSNRRRIERLDAAYVEGAISREVFEANMERFAGPAQEEE